METIGNYQYDQYIAFSMTWHYFKTLKKKTKRKRKKRFHLQPFHLPFLYFISSSFLLYFSFPIAYQREPNSPHQHKASVDKLQTAINTTINSFITNIKAYSTKRLSEANLVSLLQLQPIHQSSVRSIRVCQCQFGLGSGLAINGFGYCITG